MATLSLVRILLLFVAASRLLLVNVRAAVHEHQRRYAAMAVETGVPEPAALMPRQYYQAPEKPLEKRQGGACQAGSHPCNELGPPGEGQCCRNNAYCIVNITSLPLRASCCSIGATCNNQVQPPNPCSEPSSFLCFPPLTTTISNVPTVLPQTTSSACCPRLCASAGISFHQCPSSLGGNCCPNTETCVSNGCIKTVEPSSTPAATPVPEGCTSKQISCPAELGGGCCNDDMLCTRVDGSARCAVKTDLPDGVDLVSDDSSGGGGGPLSTGAKAGIAVGVVLVAALVIGFVTWFCIRKRRRGRNGEGGGASVSAGRPRVRPGQTIGGGGTENNSHRFAGEGHSDAGVSSRPGGGGIGTQEYAGGDPQIGPYSDEYSGRGGPSSGPPSAVTSPGMEYSSRVGGGGGGVGGAVPVIPEGPGDIATAVEIDSGEKGHWEQHESQGQGQGRLRDSSGGTAAPAQGGYFASSVVGTGTASGRPIVEDISDRFELYGSDPGQLSPLSSPYGFPTPPDEHNGQNNNHGGR
ncbi:hypothetical protein QBC44DRAFT_88231 [Cladorrhinum sp. PSN332]|nr:hypothetical protein QBC44DRAFT_88231 [Cladorrhinum sp. PSN332]